MDAGAIAQILTALLGGAGIVSLAVLGMRLRMGGRDVSTQSGATATDGSHVVQVGGQHCSTEVYRLLGELSSGQQQLVRLQEQAQATHASTLAVLQRSVQASETSARNSEAFRRTMAQVLRDSGAIRGPVTEDRPPTQPALSSLLDSGEHHT